MRERTSTTTRSTARSTPRSTTEKGRAGEAAARALLEREGYRVVETNARVGRLEIDLVAMEGDVVCFVEVRRRKRLDDALRSMTPRKQQEVARAAARWLDERRIQPRCRFDVVVVSDNGARLIRNAFEAVA